MREIHPEKAGRDQPIRVSLVVPMYNEEENAGRLPELIEEVLHSQEFADGRKEAIAETWVNVGNSVPAIADYLVAVRQRLMEGAVRGDAKKQNS